MFAARPDPGTSSSSKTTAITTTSSYRPASLELINRPIPVEPHADAQKKQNPLNGSRRESQEDVARSANQAARANDFGHILRPDQDAVPNALSVQERSDGSAAAGHANDEHDEDRSQRRKKRANAGHRDLPTLPPPRKTQKRLQIPPTLSGLHQPPPESGILPRIIVEQPRSPLREHRQLQPYPVPPPDDPRPDAALLTSLIDPQLTAAARKTDTSTGGPAAETSPPTNGKSKRNMWSEEETDFLLLGAHRFGVGDWTKIHSCPDYRFNDRTALDLKDRFRVILPDEYRKYEESLRTNGSSSRTTNRAQSGDAEDDSGTTLADTTPPPKGKRVGKGRPADRVTPARLERLGITTPFRRAKRRSRHGYSVSEDEAILEGFHKHDGKWAKIRDDPALNLSHRTATDIRDRLRNKYPELYTNTGRVKTVKPTDATRRKNLGKGRAAATATKTSGAKNAQLERETPAQAAASAQMPAIDPSLASGRHARRHADAVPGPSTHLSPHHPPHPHHHNNPYYVYATNDDVFFGAPFNPRERDDEELITLDRDILAWATSSELADRGNPTTAAMSSAPMTASSAYQTRPPPPTALPSDKGKYRTAADVAINPLETVLNPTTTLSSSTAAPSRPSIIADALKSMHLAHVTSSSSSSTYPAPVPPPRGSTAVAATDGGAGFASSATTVAPRSQTILPSMLPIPSQSDQQLPSLNQWYNVTANAGTGDERGQGGNFAAGVSVSAASASTVAHTQSQGQYKPYQQHHHALPTHEVFAQQQGQTRGQGQTLPHELSQSHNQGTEAGAMSQDKEQAQAHAQTQPQTQTMPRLGDLLG